MAGTVIFWPAGTSMLLTSTMRAVFSTQTVVKPSLLKIVRMVPRMPILASGVDTPKPLGFRSTMAPVITRMSPCPRRALNSGSPSAKANSSMVMVVLGPKVTEELSANRICTLPAASVRRVSWAAMGSLRARAVSCPALFTNAPGATAATWPMGAAKACPASKAKHSTVALNCKNILMGLAPLFGVQVKKFRPAWRENTLENSK